MPYPEPRQAIDWTRKRNAECLHLPKMLTTSSTPGRPSGFNNWSLRTCIPPIMSRRRLDAHSETLVDVLRLSDNTGTGSRGQDGSGRPMGHLLLKDLTDSVHRNLKALW